MIMEREWPGAVGKGVRPGGGGAGCGGMAGDLPVWLQGRSMPGAWQAWAGNDGGRVVVGVLGGRGMAAAGGLLRPAGRVPFPAAARGCGCRAGAACGAGGYGQTTRSG